jgi:hypothetical protein
MTRNPMTQGMIIGDAPLARFICKDERQRKRIAQLQRDGWPIFDFAGKRAGFADQLAAHMAKLLARRKPRKRATKQSRRKAEAASATSAA